MIKKELAVKERSGKKKRKKFLVKGTDEDRFRKEKWSWLLLVRKLGDKNVTNQEPITFDPCFLRSSHIFHLITGSSFEKGSFGTKFWEKQVERIVKQKSGQSYLRALSR